MYHNRKDLVEMLNELLPEDFIAKNNNGIIDEKKGFNLVT